MRYFAKKVVIDGIKFDSGEEGDYYLLLKERERKGEISGLIAHPSFLLQNAYPRPNGTTAKEIVYEADFEFTDVAEGRVRVVDVKGFADDVFMLKWKLYDFVWAKGKGYPWLEVLKYSKSTGWVDYEGYKKARRAYKSSLVAQKNGYKARLDRIATLKQRISAIASKASRTACEEAKARKYQEEIERLEEGK